MPLVGPRHDERVGMRSVDSDAHCPVCGNSAVRVFYAVAQAPVTCGSVFADAASARAVARGDVQLACCERCGHISNAAFDPALAEIGARYESSQASSAHFGSFARKLAQDWIGRYALRGKRVLEVGCGHGEFLAALVEAGAASGIGFDPLADPARVPSGQTDRIRLEMDRFDDRHVDVRADALVCRHTLEHVSDVSGFLRAIRRWAERNPGAVVLIEVPATERVLAENAFWDIYYEHCGYFTQSTLELAFRLGGFRVLRTGLVYDEQYLLLEAAAADGEPPALPGDPSPALAACAAFGTHSNQAIERCRAALRDLARDGRPLVIWQAASKTVGLLTALQDDTLIDCAVDMSVHRHGRFLPPNGLPIFSPQDLAALRPKNVVLMNPVYYDEVRASLSRLGLLTNLLTINQICGEPRALDAAAD